MTKLVYDVDEMGRIAHEVFKANGWTWHPKMLPSAEMLAETIREGIAEVNAGEYGRSSTGRIVVYRNELGGYVDLTIGHFEVPEELKAKDEAASLELDDELSQLREVAKVARELVKNPPGEGSIDWADVERLRIALAALTETP